MKSVSNEYKEQLTALGRQYKVLVTYTQNNEQVELSNDELNIVTPHYEGDLLKSIMKQLDLDSNVDIPIGTEINCQFGLLVGDNYEYIDYGNYIVYSSEKQEDLKSYKIVCYDKMLNAMKDYEKIENKNILTLNYTNDFSYTINGITFTYKKDGTIVANGTATANVGYAVGPVSTTSNELREILLNQQCYLSGCPTGGSNSTYRLQLYNHNGSGGAYFDFGNGVSISPFTNQNYSYNVGIFIANGYTANNLVFKPMIEINDKKTIFAPKFQYPVSVKNYLMNLSAKIGLEFKNTEFVNDDTLITSERYLNSEGNSMGYTYRDVLDELAQVTASTICINKDDELEVRYTKNSLGKNVFDFSKMLFDHKATSVVDYKILNDNSIYGENNGGTYASIWFNIDTPPIGTYVLSATALDGDNIEGNVGIGIEDYPIGSTTRDGWHEIWFSATDRENQTRKSVQFNINSNHYYKVRVFINQASGNNKTTISNIMLEKNTTMSEYEPAGFTINETYLKDTNVNFKEKYGPINSVVFSRSGDTDLIYRKDDESIEENGLCEIKISDNQILNSNDRDNFIDEIFNQLNGLEYYINDYTSTGITILDLCDKYNIVVDEATYPCIMFNDEVNITQGFEELIHTDKPEKNESDYKKADKTDRAITQTYFIVDKLNNTMEALASRIIDITTDGTTTSNMLTISNVADSEPFNLDVIPHGESISYEFPFSRQYPSDNLFISPRTLRFHNTTTDEDIDYEFPVDILYYDTNNYDEFILDYENQICKVIKRVGYDGYGQLTPITTQELIFDYPTIHLTKGDYEIYVLNGYNVYIYGKFLLQNDYTTQMSTNVQMKSTIKETANQIMLQVEQKVSTDDIIASLNLAVENDQGIVELKGNKVSIESDNFELDENGNMYCNNATANNLNIKSGTIELANEQGIGSIRLGEVFTGFHTYLGGEAIGGYAPSMIVDDVVISPVTYNIWTEDYMGYYSGCMSLYRAFGTTLDQTIEMNGRTGAITCVSLTQTSKEENKKNFEKLENALDIVNNTDIYKYNLKFETDNEKKHIGFVIGDNFKYREEITSNKNDGADIYSMVSVLWKAVQEQQEQIKDLENQIKEMKK